MRLCTPLVPIASPAPELRKGRPWLLPAPSSSCTLAGRVFMKGSAAAYRWWTGLTESHGGAPDSTSHVLWPRESDLLFSPDALAGVGAPAARPFRCNVAYGSSFALHRYNRREYVASRFVSSFCTVFLTVMWPTFCFPRCLFLFCYCGVSVWFDGLQYPFIYRM